MAVSDRWLSLCEALAEYEPQPNGLKLARERKWELVSALQKSIRRGDKATALHVLASITSMPEEYSYFWRRLCVVACEDVGPADDVLASFVIACANIFPPKKTGAMNHTMMSFLVSQMCDTAKRSRIYCSYGIVEPAVINKELPKKTTKDDVIVSALLQNRDRILNADTLWRKWLRKSDWRAEGLLRYIGLTLPFEMLQIETAIPEPEILFDLPSYCYDMHTRIGLKSLQRVVRGAGGAGDIRDFFLQNEIRNAHRALGAALFFEEGGRIKGELAYGPLLDLEQRVFAHQHGLQDKGWWELRDLVQKALQSGVFDRVRAEVLRQKYGQLEFAIDCTGAAE